MKGSYKFAFLLSSFGPLFLIMTAKTALDPQAPVYGLWVFVTLFALSIATFVLIVLGLRRSAAQVHVLTDLKPRDSDIFPYLMTYIPSLIFKDLYSLEIGVPLLILYGLVFVLYFRLDSPYLNPFFALFGYRIHEARMEGSRLPIILISNGELLSGQETLLLNEVSGGQSAVYFYDRSQAGTSLRVN
jgi:hypothetical protein